MDNIKYKDLPAVVTVTKVAIIKAWVEQALVAVCLFFSGIVFGLWLAGKF